MEILSKGMESVSFSLYRSQTLAESIAFGVAGASGSQDPSVGLTWWMIVLSVIVVVAVIVLAVFLFTRMLNSRFVREQQLDAENIILVAKQRAQQIETEAMDKALKTINEGEEELQKRRNEVSRESDRVQKRRNELETRVEKIEQRESALSKRQSNLDKRSNEIDKMADRKSVV